MCVCKCTVLTESLTMPRMTCVWPRTARGDKMKLNCNQQPIKLLLAESFVQSPKLQDTKLCTFNSN